MENATDPKASLAEKIKANMEGLRERSLQSRALALQIAESLLPFYQTHDKHVVDHAVTEAQSWFCLADSYSDYLPRKGKA